MNGGWGISYEMALGWMPLDLADDKSTLVHVMAWCRQATSHHRSQCWPRSMSPNGVTRPQWVKPSREISSKPTMIPLTLAAHMVINTQIKLAVTHEGATRANEYKGISHVFSTWGWNTMADILQTTFSNLFSYVKHFAWLDITDFFTILPLTTSKPC